MKKIIFLSPLCFLSLFLVGCGMVRPNISEVNNAYFGSYPENYKEIMKNYLDKHLKDPFSAQYQYSTAPQKAWANLLGNIYYVWGTVFT